MQAVSRSLPIVLYHDYTTIPFSIQDACRSCFPQFDVNDLLTQSPIYPLLLSIFQQDQGSGVTRTNIIDHAETLVPGFTNEQYNNAFDSAVSSGIIRGLQPIQINWITGPPVPTYTFDPEMDADSRNSNFVKFLLGLVQGYKSPKFVRYFKYGSTIGTNAYISCESCL